MEEKTKTYSEKLRDPRWQRKRLEILSRDEFTCQHCKATDKTLNVHHKFYEKGCEPWDYEAEGLIALCEDCHKAETDEARRVEPLLIQELRLLGFTSDNILDFAGGLNVGRRFPRGGFESSRSAVADIAFGLICLSHNLDKLEEIGRAYRDGFGVCQIDVSADKEPVR